MIRRVRRDDPQPLYKQVKQHLLETLYSGGLPAQGKLASERELVDQLGVSRITVRQAMKELVLEGHLQSQPGKGFYATGRPRRGYEIELVRSFTDTAVAHGKVPGSVLLAAEIVRPPEGVVRGLDLGGEDRAISLRRLRLLDSSPVAIAQDWIPVELAPDLLSLDWDRDNRSLYAELRTRYGILPDHGRTILSAALANSEEAELLRLERPAAVLLVEQIAYDRTDRPINMTYSVQHPTAYPLRLEQSSNP